MQTQVWRPLLVVVYNGGHVMKVPNQYWGSNMEENSPSQNVNGQLGPSSGVNSVANKPSEDGKQITQYSIPGILHFIQHEWARFEMERSQWEVDRAELQVIYFIFWDK